VRIAHISQVSTFVTDRCASEAVRRICAENAVELVEASVPQAEGDA
jgi:DeoR family glycerol-3-phosphate regulon repressor